MNETKMIVSKTEMARMCGLSRARFFQLVGTTFPYPLYDIATRRPFYDEEGQRICLEVRRRNYGVDGKPIMFYSRRMPTVPAPTKRKPLRPPKEPKDDGAAGLAEGLKSLGLVVAPADVEGAVKELYPNGVGEAGQGDVLRGLFLHLNRRNAEGSVAR